MMATPQNLFLAGTARLTHPTKHRRNASYTTSRAFVLGLIITRVIRIGTTTYTVRNFDQKVFSKSWCDGCFKLIKHYQAIVVGTISSGGSSSSSSSTSILRVI